MAATGLRSIGGAGLLAAAGGALALAGLLLYRRKRRQVAEHFTMGEGGSDRKPGAVPGLESDGNFRS